MNSTSASRVAGRMSFRKLRIAWSVGCGIACVLLVALWVLSYWWYGAIGGPILGNHGFAVKYWRGQLLVNSYDLSDWLPPISRWRLIIAPVEREAARADYNWIRHRGLYLSDGFLYLPCWFLVLLTGVLIAAPWLRW